jgi:hypothetical protein
MTWIRSWALGAVLVLVLLPAGTQVAFAQGYRACMANAEALRRDCLRGLGAPARFCNRNHRDDVAECRRYARGWSRRPIHPIRRPPPPISRPSPPMRPVPLPAPVPR